MFFFFNDTATTEIYTLSLHDALPILTWSLPISMWRTMFSRTTMASSIRMPMASDSPRSDMVLSVKPNAHTRSEEHTSELQSRQYLVCRLLLEKKKPCGDTRHDPLCVR